LGKRKYTGKKKERNKYIPDYPIDRGNKKKRYMMKIRTTLLNTIHKNFAWFPSTTFRKITILNPVLNINTMRIAKQRCSVFVILSDLDDFRIKKSRFFSSCHELPRAYRFFVTVIFVGFPSTIF